MCFVNLSTTLLHDEGSKSLKPKHKSRGLRSNTPSNLAHNGSSVPKERTTRRSQLAAQAGIEIEKEKERKRQASISKESKRSATPVEKNKASPLKKPSSKNNSRVKECFGWDFSTFLPKYMSPVREI